MGEGFGKWFRIAYLAAGKHSKYHAHMHTLIHLFHTSPIKLHHFLLLKWPMVSRWSSLVVGVDGLPSVWYETSLEFLIQLHVNIIPCTHSQPS